MVVLKVELLSQLDTIRYFIKLSGTTQTLTNKTLTTLMVLQEQKHLQINNH